MEQSKLQEILQKHAAWVRGEEDGIWANLTGADLTGADLTRADLTGANLSGTCLDPQLLSRQRIFVRDCPPLRAGGRIVYRTARSQHMLAATDYIPGHTYVAPYLSFSAETPCHPGIYAGSLAQIRDEYPAVSLVRCYVRDGDWTICAKGIRCARLRVLGYVEATNA